jgi:lactoylglutathione lyase
MVKLAHIALWTREIDRISAFWERVFQVEIGPLYESRNRPGFSSRFLSLSGGATIEVMSGPWVADHLRAEETGYAHIAISLGSRSAVDRVAWEMEKDGVLVAAPRLTGDGFYEAVIQDPDGNLVEITA